MIISPSAYKMYVPIVPFWDQDCTHLAQRARLSGDCYLDKNFYRLKNGLAGIFIGHGEDRVCAAVITPGMCFGGGGIFFGDNPVDFEVVAITACDIQSISKGYFEDNIYRSPGFSRFVLSQNTQYEQLLYRIVYESRRKDIDTRLLDLLSELSSIDSIDSEGGKGSVIDLPYDLIALILGIDASILPGILSRLESGGFLNVSSKLITLNPST